MSNPETRGAERVALPRFWLSLGVIIWAGFTDNWAVGTVMVLLLEGVSLVSVKWQLAERDFHRAADLSSVIFGVMTVIQFSRYSVHGIYQILSVCPICFFPLVLAQRASTHQSIPLSALFYSMRRWSDAVPRMDINPHYLIVCLMAASTSSSSSKVVFGALGGLLVIGLLLAFRPRRYGFAL